MKGHMRQIRKHAESLGLQVVRIDQSKHYRMEVRSPDGRSTTFTFSVSPGCPFTVKNAHGDLRRFAENRANSADNLRLSGRRP